MPSIVHAGSPIHSNPAPPMYIPSSSSNYPIGFDYISEQQFQSQECPYSPFLYPLQLFSGEKTSPLDEFNSTELINKFPNTRLFSSPENEIPALKNDLNIQQEVIEEEANMAKHETPSFENKSKSGHKKASEEKRNDFERNEEEEKNLSSSSRKRFITGQAYNYRNVYKSVIRHMYNYTKKNKKTLKQLLKKEGYEDVKIKTAFETIRQYKPPDKPKDIEKKSQYRIEGILKSKAISTFILRETLVFMLSRWKSGHHGQLFEDNIQLYIEGCKKLLDEVNDVLK